MKSLVLTVGDVMLDRYVYGEVSRISAEAPIPVLQVSREAEMLGGAGNVLRNLAVLNESYARLENANPLSLAFASVVGGDGAAQTIDSLLKALPHLESTLVADRNRPTTRKLRYVAGTQQLLRADYEKAIPVSDITESELRQNITPWLKQAKVLVISDYAKGVLTETFCQDIIRMAKAAGATVLVNPKGRVYQKYAGADIIIPNRRELHEATGLAVRDDDEIVSACDALQQQYGFKAVLATRASDGMTLLERGQAPVHIQSTAREIYDVSGASDTVVATLALLVAQNETLPNAARIANIAAGVVVGKMGTATLAWDEVQSARHVVEVTGELQKIMSASRVRDVAETWRHGKNRMRIGFTNGCFDLLHPGHVSLLSQARAQCDRLIVGLNTDASVKRLKGETRPVQNEQARAQVLASLAAVDAVVLFDDDTPIELIKTLLPDVLFKGADYSVEQVVGADVVTNNGGRVALIPLEQGHSTTNLIKKMSV